MNSFRFQIASLITIGALSASSIAAPVPAPPTFGGTNLELWLSARSLAVPNGTAVSTWADAGTGTLGLSAIADLGNEPTFTTNVINGQPTLRFDGTTDFMDIASDTLSVGTVVILASYRFTPFQNYSGLFGAGFAVNPPGVTNGNFIYFTGDSGFTDLFTHPGGTTYINGNATNIVPVLNKFNIYGATATPVTGPQLDIAVGGTGHSYYDAWRLGMDRSEVLFQGSRNWKGDIAEVLIYDTILTSAQLKSVNGYLAEVYALPEPASVAAVALFVGGCFMRRTRRRC